MLVSLFDDLTIAHERISRVAETMSSLCKVLSLDQLMLVMKSSICPLVQLNTIPGLFDQPAWKEKKELPDDREERIKETMIPRPENKELLQQPNLSPTRLLVAMLSYFLHKNLTQGTTMAELQRKYIVQPKPLALCITGCKYLGRAKRRAMKYRTSQEGDEPSTSKYITSQMTMVSQVSVG